MKKIVNILAILLFLFCFLSFTSVRAQEKTNQILFKISPSIINISLLPGKTYNYTLTIENLSNSPLPLSSTLEDFQTTEDNEGYALTETTTQSPLIQWITIDKTDLILKAKEKQNIHLTVTIPNRVNLGGYYALLFFHPIMSNTNAQIPLSTKVGVLLLANVGVPDVKKKRGEITQFSLDKFIYNKGPITTHFSFKNTLLHFYSVKPFLTISPLFGKPQKFLFEEKFTFPGKMRKWDEVINLDSYSNGIYKATLGISVGEGKQITQSVYFIAFPWKITILTIMSIGILIWIFKNKKRIVKALKILFSKSL
jgi:hypothetical protein